ncbi:cilia- and flagella-associated protein 221 [Cephus cinctus]|uniref:Cilia- and flagella-associated protein 221 n=1 Tax=Cephus cinctus TaxID=211228 RepID=A0AAJ7FQ57_CEPCN|nr:cilia- and flagella-associated protein 221 [Cephus cinctus]
MNTLNFIRQDFCRKERSLRDTFYDDIYKDSSKNDFIKVIPDELIFTFDTLYPQKQQKYLKILNIGLKPYPVQVLPPDTSYFKVSNSSTVWISPGLSLNLRVIFYPKDVREYNDVLRLRCLYNQNLFIKILAKPETLLNFPTRVNFGKVLLGTVVSYKLPIHSFPSKKFSFAILILSDEPSVTVNPLQGHLCPGQDPVIVQINYKALRYVTITFDLQIYIPEICKSPFVINFIAYTWPELQVKDTHKPVEEFTKIEVVKESDYTEKTIRKAKILSPKVEFSMKKELSYEDLLLKQLGQIPLYSLHGVNCILNYNLIQTHTVDELRGPLNDYFYNDARERDKRIEEFFNRVKSCNHENDSAKFYHRPKLGFQLDQLQKEEIDRIMIERQEHWSRYRDATITTADEELLTRQEAMKIKQRTLRSSLDNPNFIAPYKITDDWFLRYHIISQFIEAARTIVLKNRLEKVLCKLKKLNPKVISEIEIFVDNKQQEYQQNEKYKSRERLREVEK